MSLPVAPEDLASTPRPQIRRVRIEGGYLDGFDQRFGAGGNCVIGEHGSGKTTLLSILRFGCALYVPPAVAKDEDELLQENLGAGRVYVTFDSPAHRGEVTFSRAITKTKDRPNDPPRYEPALSRAGAAVAWSPALCPILFSGHGELSLLASDTDGKARLALVERFAGDDWAKVREAIAGVRKEMNDNADALLKIDAAVDELGQEIAPLDADEQRLVELKAEAADDPVDLEPAHAENALRERARLMMESAVAEVGALRAEVETLSLRKHGLARCIDEDVGRGPNAALLEPEVSQIHRVAAALDQMAAAVTEACDRALAVFAERAPALADVLSRQDDDYRTKVGKHAKDAGRAEERASLEKRVARLEKLRADRDARLRARAQLEAARDRLRGRLRELLAERRRILGPIADRLTKATGGRVKVGIDAEADRSDVLALLLDVVKGERFKPEPIEAIAKKIAPTDLFAQIMANDYSVVAAKIGSEAVAARFVRVVRESRRHYELETVEMEDVPEMWLLHHKAKKRHNKLSHGQRITCFVCLMLLDTRGPFVADTPENDVSAYNLAANLCPSLAELAAHGQYIVVSHNGNVPILGRAGHILELDAPDGTRGVVKTAGPPREAVEPMENHLEGGREAFVARREFYEV